MIFAVRLEMILELQNALAEDCYLNFWRTGVSFVDSVLYYNFFFCVSRQCHARMDTPRLFLISFFSYSVAQEEGGVIARSYRAEELSDGRSL